MAGQYSRPTAFHILYTCCQSLDMSSTHVPVAPKDHWRFETSLTLQRPLTSNSPPCFLHSPFTKYRHAVMSRYQCASSLQRNRNIALKIIILPQRIIVHVIGSRERIAVAGWQRSRKSRGNFEIYALVNQKGPNTKSACLGSSRADHERRRMPSSILPKKRRQFDGETR